ncbi:pyridoxine 5'-phosphate synthase [Thermophagus xiamenensis]|jgi:pyridoxine 5-phosphate synthase|uniref:Pyridoxine 5'-phosphate synthase n=1 Tax=Thermophagus xiamenensis TaxID=385682 RepID=A0A1I1XVG9_9BACT|nr:pyridoxine 5'-phosphate synthase [Thermophagus xiamenensis]SFE09883.1 pyridoxine 5'-phosphate synthase [Thermophagus xiamenensis]
MTKLSVNINKIATLRNSRGGNIPDVLKAAIDVQKFGADGVTVHPRPDERHIRYKDVHEIRPIIQTELNIEGYPSPKFIDLVKTVRPHQVTLVPDPPDAITSNSGWDTINNLSFLQDIIGELKEYGIRTSIFVDPNPDIIINAAKTNTDRIELYTEPYAALYPKDREKAIAPFVEAATIARDMGLKINAGHDLNLQNLKFFNERIPFIKEVSIGHALISDALYFGLEVTINKYKQLLIKD